MLKRIGIAVGKNKDMDYRHTRIIVEKLLANGFEVILSPEVKASINLDTIQSESVFDEADFIICVGGDGTFLKAARDAYALKLPVLGINKGTVGFLAEVEPGEIESALEKVMAGEYKIQPRMDLEVEVVRRGKKVYESYAINDAVVTRTALSRILRIEVNVDDKFVDSFRGDGVILSTSTGSTGYSLSAGGPIVQPDMRLIVVSPICPHILYSRSFVISDSKTVSVNIAGNLDLNAMITVDGQEGFPLESDDLIQVRAAEDSVYFASVKNVNFYDVLRAKIHSGT